MGQPAKRRFVGNRGGRPVIGIAGDVDRAPVGGSPTQTEPRACCRMSYVDAVVAAGGVPIVLPPVPEQIPDQLGMVDGVLLIGGDDPASSPFGCPTDPRVTPVEPLRQRYDTALLNALESRPEVPVLGVCYGMQMMALLAGGSLDQHLPDTLGEAWAAHWHTPHEVRVAEDAAVLLLDAEGQSPYSRHRQAIADAGRLAVAARAPDGTIEAVHEPSRRFYAGVQWHPEKSGNGPLGLGVYTVFVKACGG